VPSKSIGEGRPRQGFTFSTLKSTPDTAPSGHDHVLSEKMMARHLDWVHRTPKIIGAGGGFGVWRLCPPYCPALAGLHHEVAYPQGKPPAVGQQAQLYGQSALK
jgi:hypothetical protein